MPRKKRICEICGEEFIPKTYNQKYCREKCRKRAQLNQIGAWIKNKYRTDPQFREKMLSRGATRQHSKHNEVAEYMRNYRKKHPEKFERATTIYKRWLRKRRWAVLAHYGGLPPKCACCGEDKYEFLSIEHKEGNPDMRTVKERRNGIRIEEWLIKNNFPEGFAVLCFNCNLARGFHGFCPHKNPEKSFMPPDGHIFKIEMTKHIPHTKLEYRQKKYRVVLAEITDNT